MLGGEFFIFFRQNSNRGHSNRLSEKEIIKEEDLIKMMWLPVINQVATLQEVENYWSMDDLFYYIDFANEINKTQNRELENVRKH